ncbi:MAG: hypothetical protein AAF570_06315 [Bacteroidota bacterium]
MGKKAKPAKTLAILGRNRRTGRWRLAKSSSVLAVFGSCLLDMRHSFAEDDDELKMTVLTVCGSARILLPEGAEVRPSGTAVLASSIVDVPEHDDPADLPTLEIEWLSILGRLRIVTDRAEELEDAEAPTAAEAEPAPTTTVAAATPAPEPAPVAEPAPEPAPTSAPAAEPAAEPAPEPAPTSAPAAEPAAEPAATELAPSPESEAAEPAADEGEALETAA